MNWAAWAPAIVALIASVFTYGRLTEKISGHTERLKEHDDRLEAHAAHLNKVDIALVRLEEYNRGLSDAAKLAHKTH